MLEQTTGRCPCNQRPPNRPRPRSALGRGSCGGSCRRGSPPSSLLRAGRTAAVVTLLGGVPGLAGRTRGPAQVLQVHVGAPVRAPIRVPALARSLVATRRVAGVATAANLLGFAVARLTGSARDNVEALTAPPTDV